MFKRLFDLKRCDGSTRMVFLTTNYAIKIPSFVEWRLFLHGLLANMSEVNFSTMNKPQICPVLWSLNGGFVLIMPRAKSLTLDEFAAFDFDAFITQAGWQVPVENKLDSFGWLNGRIVAVDYG